MARKTKKGHTALRQALLSKAGKSKQWLSIEAARRMRLAPMSLKVAQAIVAHENGLRLERYLEAQDLTEVRQVMRDMTRVAQSTSVERTPAARSKLAKPRQVVIKASKLAYRDPFLPKDRINEAREMAAVYPLLYLLENSLREIIGKVMAARFGDDWWQLQIQGGKLNGTRDKVASRRRTETANSWHQRRGAHELDYTDFDDLLAIAQSKPDIFFPVLLGEQEWFKQFFRELVPSRNVVCHMNPLSTTNVDDVSVKLQRWEEHLTRRDEEIRAAMLPQQDDAAATQPVVGNEFSAPL